MGTIANPALTSLLPGANQSGTQISMGPGTGPSNNVLPVQNPSSSAPTNPNPFTTGIVPTSGSTTVPSFSANTGGYPSSLNLGGGAVPGAPNTNVGQAAASPIGGLSQMSPKDLSRMFDSLKKTYGDGTAHAILDFLTSGAGFNQQAVNNMLASLQPGIERGTESLMQQFSTSGNRFGSGAQIGLGDYLSQVNLNEGQIVSQMYEQAVNNYMNTLLGVGGKVADTKAQSPSGMDSILQGLGLAQAGGSGLQELSQGISGMSSTADTGILDAIAGAAVAI